MPQSFELVAHRGDSTRYAENTLSAMQDAVDCGVRFLEMDVQLSADHVPILCHDADLQRVAGSAVPVLDTQWNALRRWPLHKAESRATTPGLSSLAEVMQWLCDHREVTAFVELKTESLERFGTQIVLDAVMADISTVLEQVVVISYSDAACQAARRAGVRAIGWVLREYSHSAWAKARELQPDWLICNRKRLPPTPADLWPGPWEWISYEIRDVASLNQVLEQGVRFVESMRPCGLLEALARSDGRS